MAARLASALLVAAALTSAATSAQAGTSRPLDATAKSVSDTFVRSLVVRRDLVSARRSTSPRFADLQRLSSGFVRDGVDSVVGPSRILRGCRTTATGKPSPRGDCVLYHLRGRRRAQGIERRTDAAFKIWLRQETGAWKVWAYDYSALVTACPGRCP